MKLAFVFIVCFVAISMQKNVRWRVYNNPYQQYPSYRHYQEVEKVTYHPRNPSQGGLNSFFQSFFFNNYQDDFFNYFINVLRPTVTLQPTTISTIVSQMFKSCYISTMFARTTACRGNLRMLDSISEEDMVSEVPTQHEALNSVVDQLPREGRDMNVGDLIESSKEEFVSSDPPLRKFKRNDHSNFFDFLSLFGTATGTSTATVYGTSTVTFFSYFFSTFTVIIRDLASASELSCVPVGFKLC